MKRFSKLKTKKGFTLLETLLATCILVIIGSMLMEGFITAMGYSYNSSVYSRSAAYNSKLCVDQLNKWSMYADGIQKYSGGSKQALDARYYDVGKEAQSQTNGFQANKLRQITFSTLGTVRIATYEKTTVATGAANLGSFSKETIKDNDNAVADNRAIFFYYPTKNGTNYSSDSYFGNTDVYLKNGTDYVWGYEQGGTIHELGARTKEKNVDEGSGDN